MCYRAVVAATVMILLQTSHASLYWLLHQGSSFGRCQTSSTWGWGRHSCTQLPPLTNTFNSFPTQSCRKVWEAVGGPKLSKRHRRSTLSGLSSGVDTWMSDLLLALGWSLECLDFVFLMVHFFLDSASGNKQHSEAWPPWLFPPHRSK